MPILASQQINLSALVTMVDIDVNATNSLSFCNTSYGNSLVAFTHQTSSEVPNGTRSYLKMPFDFGSFTETEAGPQPIVKLSIGKLDGVVTNFIDRVKQQNLSMIGATVAMTVTRAPFIDNIELVNRGQFGNQVTFTVSDVSSPDNRSVELTLKTALDFNITAGQFLLANVTGSTRSTAGRALFLNGIRL